MNTTLELTAPATGIAIPSTPIDVDKLVTAPPTATRLAERAANAKSSENHKLIALVRTIRGLDVPPFSNRMLADSINVKVDELAAWVESQINAELL